MQDEISLERDPSNDRDGPTVVHGGTRRGREPETVVPGETIVVGESPVGGPDRPPRDPRSGHGWDERGGRGPGKSSDREDPEYGADDSDDSLTGVVRGRGYGRTCKKEGLLTGPGSKGVSTDLTPLTERPGTVNKTTSFSVRKLETTHSSVCPVLALRPYGPSGASVARPGGRGHPVVFATVHFG